MQLRNVFCLKKNAPSYGQTHQGKLHCGGSLKKTPPPLGPQKVYSFARGDMALFAVSHGFVVPLGPVPPPPPPPGAGHGNFSDKKKKKTKN